MASKVLIVEDDPNTVELLRLYLGRDGHKVLVASDGLEGLRLAREAHPDLARGTGALKGERERETTSCRSPPAVPAPGG